MTNSEIALALEQLAFFLELQEDDPHKIQSYLKAARHIRESTHSLEAMLAGETPLTSINGVGKVIAKKIEDLIILGEIPLLTELKKQFPVELFELTRIKGLGPKSILRLFQKDGIRSCQDLRHRLQENAALDIPPHIEKKIREHFKL